MNKILKKLNVSSTPFITFLIILDPIVCSKQDGHEESRTIIKVVAITGNSNSLLFWFCSYLYLYDG